MGVNVEGPISRMPIRQARGRVGSIGLQAKVPPVETVESICTTFLAARAFRGAGCVRGRHRGLGQETPPSGYRDRLIAPGMSMRINAKPLIEQLQSNSLFAGLDEETLQIMARDDPGANTAPVR